MARDVLDLLGLGEEWLQALRGGGLVGEACGILRDDVDLLAGVAAEALLGDVARGLRLGARGVVVRVEVARQRGSDPDDHDHGDDPEQDHAATAAVCDVSETG